MLTQTTFIKLRTEQDWRATRGERIDVLYDADRKDDRTDADFNYGYAAGIQFAITLLKNDCVIH